VAHEFEPRCEAGVPLLNSTDLAKDAGLSVQLHFIDAPADERWRRVETRNARRGETYQLDFDVTREMFDFVEGLGSLQLRRKCLPMNSTAHGTSTG